MTRPPSASVAPGALRCPFGQEFVHDPHRVMARLREDRPVSRVLTPRGQAVWLVTKDADVRRVLSDPRFALGTGRTARSRPLSRTLIGYGPPDHTRLRRLAAPQFTPSALRAHRPAVEARAVALLDRMGTDRPVDLLAEFAYPFTFGVMCDLLSVPGPARLRLYRALLTLFRRGSRGTGDRAAAAVDVESYFRDEVGRRREQPDGGAGGDCLSGMINAWQEAGNATEDELVSLCATFLPAGFDSTAQMIGIAALELYRRAGQPAKLRAGDADPRRVVEEVLRYDTPGPSATPRTTTVDVEVSGVRLPAGDRVLASIVAANHDPAIHRDPDRLDIGRAAPVRHLTFGLGPHYCPGAALARLELEAAVKAMTARFERIEPVLPLRWTGTHLVRGLEELVVRGRL